MISILVPPRSMPSASVMTASIAPQRPAASGTPLRLAAGQSVGPHLNRYQRAAPRTLQRQNPPLSRSAVPSADAAAATPARRGSFRHSVGRPPSTDASSSTARCGTPVSQRAAVDGCQPNRPLPLPRVSRQAAPGP